MGMILQNFKRRNKKKLALHESRMQQANNVSRRAGTVVSDPNTYPYAGAASTPSRRLRKEEGKRRQQRWQSAKGECKRKSRLNTHILQNTHTEGILFQLCYVENYISCV